MKQLHQNFKQLKIKEKKKGERMNTSHLALVAEICTFKWHRCYYIRLTLLHSYFRGKRGGI